MQPPLALLYNCQCTCCLWLSFSLFSSPPNLCLITHLTDIILAKDCSLVLPHALRLPIILGHWHLFLSTPSWGYFRVPISSLCLLNCHILSNPLFVGSPWFPLISSGHHAFKHVCPLFNSTSKEPFHVSDSDHPFIIQCSRWCRCSSFGSKLCLPMRSWRSIPGFAIYLCHYLLSVNLQHWWTPSPLFISPTNPMRYNS